MTGRELPPTSAFAGDDGSADPGVAAALAAYASRNTHVPHGEHATRSSPGERVAPAERVTHDAGPGTVAAVVAALAGTRVLVPVLAELDSAGTVEVGGHTHTVEKEASAGIVALQAPDGRTALPVFSSVATMAAWRRDARPVPTEVARAALSAVEEGWELLVLDPGGPTTVLLPRPAVWALAQQLDWQPAVVDGAGGRSIAPDVRAAVRDAVRAAFGGVTVGRAEGATPAPGPVTGTATAPRSAPETRRWWRRGSAAPATAAPATGTPATGSPSAPGPLVDVDATPGSRAEVAVELRLVPGLDRAALDAVLTRVGAALAADETVAQRVDSVEVRLR